MRAHDLCVAPSAITGDAPSPLLASIPQQVAAWLALNNLDPESVIQIDSTRVARTDMAGNAYALTFYAVEYLKASGRVVFSKPMPGWYDNVAVRVLVWDSLSGMKDGGESAPVWVIQSDHKARAVLRLLDPDTTQTPFVVYAGASPVGYEIRAFIPRGGGQFLVVKCSGAVYRAISKSRLNFAGVGNELQRVAADLCR